MKTWTVDLTDLDASRRLLGALKPDIVFHLAGCAAGARDPGLVIPTFQSNLATTVNVLMAAREVGTNRIVLPGSLEESEEATLSPSSPYAASKWAASAYARMFHSLFGTPVAIARVFLTYGPTTRDFHKLVPYVILSLLRGESPRLSSGRRKVDWIYIDDVIDGLLVLAKIDQAIGKTLDIGSGALVSIRELVEKIVGIVRPDSAPHFDLNLDREFEVVRMADLRTTFEMTGWRPRVSLEEGLLATVHWFKEMVNRGTIGES